MDLVTCVALSTVVVYTLVDRCHLSPLSPTLTALCLCLAQYFTVKFYRIYHYPRYLSPLRGVPGPKNDHFLIGQAYNLYNAGPAETHLSWMKQFPDSSVIRFLDIGNSEGLLLNSVKTSRDVLQTQCYKFVKPSFMRRVLGEIIGTGLFFAEGEAHKKQRRLLTGPLSYGNTKELLPLFDSKAQELTMLLQSTIARDPDGLVEGKSCNTIVSSLFSKTALDVIGLACLGIEMNNLSSPSAFALAYEVVFQNTAWSAIMSALSVYLPIRKLVPIRANREYLQANHTIRTLLRQRIRKRKAELQEPNEKAPYLHDRDLLSMMIRERGKGEEIWTEDEMLGHLLNFMAAGHETSAGSLTLTVHILANHPDVQERLRKEILKKGFPPVATPEDVVEIDKLPYLRNFTKEVFRIIAHREAAEDVVIDGVAVPKGTIIHIVPAVLHRSEKIWGPTVDDFDPNRWDHLPDEARDPFASGSFLNGPRICIGKSFALLEYKTILIRLLENFVFEDPDHRPLRFQRGAVTLRPEGGMHLKIKPRKAYALSDEGSLHIVHH